MGETTLYITRKQRLIIAFGGFLFFIGVVVLALAILTTTNTVDIENLFQFGFFTEVLVVIGVLDVIAGILLLRFSSH